MSEPETLSYEKCLELLRAAIVGRVAFNTEQGPRIIPVNYTTVGDAVVFRTTPYSLLGTHAQGARLAFEIDHIDYADQKGWSVVATGTGELVEDVRDLSDASALWNPKPWAGGSSRLLYVRLPWSEVTGRRLGGGWTHDNELPVRRH
jgi:nitroimidazol reductase NimA-like FMN-containing flavoprotein (pyridoxamine 5'-phosphate oxidase superfamily)